MIEFIHTSKKFGEHVVHKDINLTIPDGKITYIIGPSGTGKSVFLKQVIGLIRPDSGQILIDGKNVPDMNDAELLKMRRNFGFLFQNAALFDSMTVFDNVAFPLREHTDMSDDDIREAVHNKLLQVGMKDVDDKYPSELSGGMRKRVGLARAVMLDPQFMLYDEPTTGLDPIMTDVVDELIRQTQQSRGDMTSVVISHDIKSTLSIADKIIMIYNGYVVAEGDPKFFNTTDNPIVRQFFSGSRNGPINLY